jgi:hypothetical protein
MTNQSESQNRNVLELPCPICSGTSYTWGLTVSDSPGGRLYSRPDGETWGGGRELFTRECNQCHNVQFFTARPVQQG